MIYRRIYFGWYWFFDWYIKIVRIRLEGARVLPDAAWVATQAICRSCPRPCSRGPPKLFSKEATRDVPSARPFLLSKIRL